MFFNLFYRFFNLDTLITIATACLQISYVEKYKKFDIFNFFDGEIWSALIQKLKDIDLGTLSKIQSIKLYLFFKLMDFDKTLSNELFSNILNELTTQFKSFENRIISNLQLKIENELKKLDYSYIMEPDLINDVFSVDFILKNKKIILEVDGIHHFFIIIQKGIDLKNEFDLFTDNHNLINLIEPCRYTDLKKSILNSLGFKILNITYLDIEKYEGKKLSKFIENYINLIDKDKVIKIMN